MIDERRRLLGMHWALPVFPSPKKKLHRAPREVEIIALVEAGCL
jgi:hypothetical protein